MAGEGASVTNPNLNLDDFIGLQFTTGPDGKLYQLPDQQFANLYWFRYDWFTDEKTMADFEAEYGYPLGVPVNWSAYEDIAEFFTGRDMSYLGVEGEVYGNMDYGKKDPSLGWRYHRRVDVDGRHGRCRRAERPAGRRMGHPGQRELAARGVVRDARRGHQFARGRLCREQGDRMAAELFAARRCRHDLLRGRSDPGAGPDRAADVLVHRLHRRHGGRRGLPSFTTTARRAGAWRPARTASTGKKVRRSAIRMPGPGR
jgi:hypothetical protein